MIEAVALAKRYWHFAAVALLALLLGVQTYRIAALKQRIAERAAEAAEQYANGVLAVIVKERAAARISEERAVSHEKKIADLRVAAARRLQALTGSTAPLPNVPNAAFQPHEAAGRDRLCIETSFAIALMLAADENTQQLVDLQAWLRQQQKALK